MRATDRRCARDAAAHATPPRTRRRRIRESPTVEPPRAECSYNGLNWRIAKRAGTWQIMPEHGAISLPPAEPLDQERRMFYSANWQLLEEHIEDGRDGESAFDANRHMQYVWGTRYIDDIVARRQDSNLNGTLDQTWYHITDTLFSTVAILDDTAKLVERVSYDAYGNARHHRAGDLDGDGARTIGDQLILLANWGNFGVGDLNRNGIVDTDDLNLLNASPGPALPAGRISTSGGGGTDNIIGYAGYVFNAEVHGSGLYTVRHRVYDVNLSRWITRDPIGYVDGMSLYEYVRGNSVRHTDPKGLYAAVLVEGPEYDPIEDHSLPDWEDLCGEWYEQCMKDTHNKLSSCRHLLDRCSEYEFWAWYRNERRDMKWLEGLPDCPCTVACNSLGWVVPRGFQRGFGSRFADWWYHDSAWCIRSSTTNVHGAAQQCCYDGGGRLITSGGGAGTPDRAPAPTRRHQKWDVHPFDRARDLDNNDGGRKFRDMYHEVRPPNHGGPRRQCRDNPSPWN